MGRQVLKWSGEHFLLRFTDATLSLRLLHVDGDSKVVDALDFAELPVKAEGLEPLPSEARLVAAREVENEELGICMPMLVFQANSSVGSVLPSASDRQQSPVRKNLKRRRQSDASTATCSSLYFFVLSKAAGAGSTCVLQFINRVDLPIDASAAVVASPQQSNSQDVDVEKAPSLQVQIVDGPHVVVFQPAAQELSILKLRRKDARFFVWRSGVKLQTRGGGSVAEDAPAELRSCAFVSGDVSDTPHLRIQFASPSAERSIGDVDDGYRWMVYRVSELAESATPETCVYVPTPPSEATGDDEQVTCCAVLNRGAQAWNSGSAFDLWQPKMSPAASTRSPIEVAQGTLVVTGTARNALYVYDCGVLLLSFVLPTTPCKIVQVNGGDESNTFYLAVQCSDVNRSFFFLSFNATAFHPSMSIVQAFSHVGNALVGEFTAQSSADEILLVNHVADEGETRASDLLLVKKSVLICKKHAAEKHSIHRLRVEEPASKDKVRGSKRSRDSRAKEDGVSVRYIERIKFGSKQRANDDESDDAGAKHLVSQSQLVQLTKSLEKRLQNGIGELDRLEIIVSDKRDLVRHLNYFVQDEWWRSQQQEEDGDSGSLPFAAVHSGSQLMLGSGSRSEIEMRTLVSASEDAQRSNEPVQLSAAYSLNPLVALEDFQIVEFVPSTSLFRLEVVLRNRSARSVRNAYISLVNDSVNASGSISSASVSGLQSSSSVQQDFRPASENADGLARFVLDAQLPPSFGTLRSKQIVKANIWLHCNVRDQPDGEGVATDMRENPAPNSVCSMLVGSVEICPHEFILSQNALDRQRKSSYATRELEKLLILSSGTNLNQVFSTKESNRADNSPIDQMQSQRILLPELVRPTFVLASLAIRERELSKYHLSQLLLSLPSDVYTMVNPLQEARVREVGALLKAMRIEMIVMQRRSANALNDSNNVGDAMSIDSDASQAHRQWELLTSFRRLQKETDLKTAKLLHNLQKRANYHSMWHADSG